MNYVNKFNYRRVGNDVDLPTMAKALNEFAEQAKKEFHALQNTKTSDTQIIIRNSGGGGAISNLPSYEAHSGFETITAATITILYDKPFTNNYVLFVWVVDSGGVKTDLTGSINSQTMNGFVVTSDTAGTLYYMAVGK